MEPQNDQNSLQRIKNSISFTVILFSLINIILFALSFNIFKVDDFSICIFPIFYKHQYYRIITHNFFHLNLVHILFNLLTFWFIGRELEKKIGSLFLLNYILITIFTIAFVYLSICYGMLSFLVDFMKLKEFEYYNYYCSAGFSGLIFGLFYLHTSFNSIANRTTLFLGMFPIKSKFIPLIYLVFIQIINPASSFIGHVSGLIAGALVKYLFSFCFMPSKQNIIAIEVKMSGFFGFMERCFNYVRINSVYDQYNDISEFDRSIWSLFQRRREQREFNL